MAASLTSSLALTNSLSASSTATLSSNGHVANGNGSTSTVITVKVRVPDCQSEKSLQLRLDELVHSAKRRALDQLGQGLSDKLNYGLYCPDSRGRAGKFLQEERLLSEYPMSGPVGELELKYKRRIYRNTNLSLGKIKRANAKSSLKQFVESVQAADVTLANRLLGKGVDPNFHCNHNGAPATPLIAAAALPRPREMILALVYAGAHLDFREARGGQTAMHKAAISGNAAAVQTLLDLGQSPNCLDARGLTPLYHSILQSGSTVVAEMLLYDGSVIGVRDNNGMVEIHQACKLGREHHLELLLIYGADINELTEQGNTPLHCCALANQIECARILLRSGANKLLKNYSGFTPEDVARAGDRLELAGLIRGYTQAEVIPVQARPRLNQRRRSSWQKGTGGQDRAWGSLANVALMNDPYSQRQHQQQLQPQQHAPSRSISSLFAEDGSSYGGAAGSRASVSSAVDFGNTRATVARESTLVTRELPSSLVVRTVVIQRGVNGSFGFTLQGSRTGDLPTSDVSGRRISAVSQGITTQYLGPVEPGLPAHLAGMRAGDLVLSINGVDVRNSSHIECLSIAKRSGDTLTLQVATPQLQGRDRHSSSVYSAQSDSLQAIDLLDRTLNRYDDHQEDHKPASAAAVVKSSEGISTDPEVIQAEEPAPTETPKPIDNETRANLPEYPAAITTNEVPGTITEGSTSAAAAAVAVVLSTSMAVSTLLISAETDAKPHASDSPTKDEAIPAHEDLQPTILPAPDGFGNEETASNLEPQQHQEIDEQHPPDYESLDAQPPSYESADEQQETLEEIIRRKLSTLSPLPAPTAPPAPPPPPPLPKPPGNSSNDRLAAAEAAIVIRRRSLLAKPAAATPHHDRELRRLVEERRKRMEAGQLDPARSIEAQLNRKSAGSRIVVVPPTASKPVAPDTAPKPKKMVSTPEGAKQEPSSPVQLRRTDVVQTQSQQTTPAVAASSTGSTRSSTERPISFTGKAEELRQRILQQQQQQQRLQLEHQRQKSQV